MAEPKYRISVLGEQTVVTASELDAILANDTNDLVEIVGPAGDAKGADAVYLNRDNEAVREQLSAEQLRNRKELGQTNLVFGADDPKIAAARATDKRKMEMAAAEDWAGLAAVRPFVPGIQFIENNLDIVNNDPDEAAYYRSNLLATGPGKFLNLAGNIGAFFAAGGAIKMLGGKAFATAIALNSRKTVLGKGVQLMGENFLLDTQMYANQVLNYNKDFSIQDWGSEIVAGQIAAAPFAAAWKLKNIAGSLGKKALQHFPGFGDDVMGLSRNVLVVAGLAKSGQAASKLHRRAAQLGVGQRVLRKIMPKRQGGSFFEDVRGTASAAYKEGIKIERELNRYTPKSIAGMTVEQQQFAKQRLRDLSGEALPFLDDIDFQTVQRNIKTGHSSIRSISNPLSEMNMKVKPPAAIDSVVDEAMYNLRVEEASARLETAGYGDILGYLDNTLNLEAAGTSFGQWVKARFDARLGNFKNTPGGVAADKITREFIQDADVWGAKTAARGEVINKAIDQITDGYKVIDDFKNVIPENTANIEHMNVNQLNAVDEALESVRQGYETLRKQGAFSEEMTRGLETKLGKVQRDVAQAKASYLDAAKINQARRSAQLVNDEMVSTTKARKDMTDEELSKIYEEAAVQNGAKLAAFKETLVDSLKGLGRFYTHPNTVRFPSYGVIAAKYYTSEEERRAMFDIIEGNVRAFAGNPVAMAEAFSQQTLSLARHEPALTFRIEQQASYNMLYLNSILPKVDLSYTGDSDLIHIATIDEFLDGYFAMQEPISVGVAAAMGIATPNMVKALKATNPAIYAEMYSVVAEEMDKLTPEERLQIPPATLHGLDLLVGGLNPAAMGENLMYLQRSYSQTKSEEEQLTGGAPRRKVGNPGPQDPGSDYTFSQRITGY